jgi:hypothetical protein
LRFIHRAFLLVVLAAYGLIPGTKCLVGQTAPAAVPWDRAKSAGLALKQNLVLGEYRVAVQYVALVLDLVAGSAHAEQIEENIKRLWGRAPLAGDLEPTLTAPLLPTADKFLDAIDRNDAAAITPLTVQMMSQLHGVFTAAEGRRAARSEWLNSYLNLQDMLDLWLQKNEVAKAVVKANELQVMIDGMKSKHEDIPYYARNVYDINDALGREAFVRGDFKTAGEYLLKAADIPAGTPGATTLRCAGPNLWLAKSLLDAGYREVVLKFLEECRQFWTQPAEGQLEQWIAAIRSGASPDLLPNAAVGM